MERITKFRARILLGLFGLILCFFAFRLYDLQIIQTGGKPDNTTTFTTVTRIKAARGDILDRNGNVLVGNRASYDLVINHYVLLSSNGSINALHDLVMLCKERGIEYEEHFPVSRTRPFTYTLEEYNSAWQQYFQTFLSNQGRLDSDITAPLLVKTLRERYEFPAEWTDEESRLVIGLLYELKLRGYTNLPNFVVVSDAKDEDLSAILELNIPGLNVEASTVREYHTAYAAHILGYVGKMTADQWEKYKELGYSMDAVVGQSGFELAFEDALHGTDGWRVDKVTPDGTVIESYYETEPKAGNNVEVTVDINLQMVAEDQLAKAIEDLRANPVENADGRDAEGAAAVVIDVKTGQVLVCASYPTYDPSTLLQQFDEILETPFAPMYNRALNAAYPPGSTYKMSTATAAMDCHIIDLQRVITDEGVFTEYENFSPKCLVWSMYRQTHGDLTVVDAITVSCNYFFYVLGDEIPLSVMDSTAAGFGLGEPTGVELPEVTGYRANRETKEKLHTGFDSTFFQADKILSAIGQADNQFTPMQLCVYASTLANRGTRYKATFLNRIVSADYRSLVVENEPEIAHIMDISDEAYKAYSEGMRNVVEDPRGTAYRFFRGFPYAVAAKTGTAQTGMLGSDNGAFICYTPCDKPEIAIAVYGEKAGHGSSMAVVAKALIEAYYGVDDVGDVITYENRPS